MDLDDLDRQVRIVAGAYNRNLYQLDAESRKLMTLIADRSKTDLERFLMLRHCNEVMWRLS